MSELETNIKNMIPEFIKKQPNQIKYAIIIYLLTLIFWITLVCYREYNNTDIYFLRDVYYDCDGWCLLHFFNYILLGFFAPDYWKEILFIAVAYEFVEMILNKTVSKYIDAKLVSDTIINTTGLFVGIGLHKTFYKTIFG